MGVTGDTSSLSSVQAEPLRAATATGFLLPEAGSKLAGRVKWRTHNHHHWLLLLRVRGRIGGALFLCRPTHTLAPSAHSSSTTARPIPCAYKHTNTTNISMRELQIAQQIMSVCVTSRAGGCAARLFQVPWCLLSPQPSAQQVHTCERHGPWLLTALIQRG